MKIFGVDPGTKKSGWCYINIHKVEGLKEINFGHDFNSLVIEQGKQYSPSLIIGYEWVKNYGRVVGEDVFRTAYMCGRVREALSLNANFFEPTRPCIIKHFTGRTNLPKSEVRKVLLDRFGGPDAKKAGGPLHKISNHAWDAMAVCLYIKEYIYGIDKKIWSSN